jgi:hypothetical protein
MSKLNCAYARKLWCKKITILLILSNLRINLLDYSDDMNMIRLHVYFLDLYDLLTKTSYLI